jgi:hypothetical protein
MKVILIILGLFLFASTANACECRIRGSFLEVAPKSKLVAHIKVKRYIYNKDHFDQQFPEKMEAEVIQVYQGKESRKNIIIWGAKGLDCRVLISQFKEGESYLIGFESEIELKEGNEKVLDYYISSCGTFVLSIEKQNNRIYAFGDIGKEKERMRLNEVKKLLKKINFYQLFVMLA